MTHHNNWISIVALVGLLSAGCDAQNQPKNNAQGNEIKWSGEKSSPNEVPFRRCILDHIQGGVTPTKWNTAARECRAEFPNDPMPDQATFLFSDDERYDVDGLIGYRQGMASLTVYNGNRTRGIQYVEIKLSGPPIEVVEELGITTPNERFYRVEIEIPPLSARTIDFPMMWDKDLMPRWNVENVWGYVDYTAVDLEEDIEFIRKLDERFRNPQIDPQ